MLEKGYYYEGRFWKIPIYARLDGDRNDGLEIIGKNKFWDFALDFALFINKEILLRDGFNFYIDEKSAKKDE